MLNSTLHIAGIQQTLRALDGGHHAQEACCLLHQTLSMSQRSRGCGLLLVRWLVARGWAVFCSVVSPCEGCDHNSNPGIWMSHGGLHHFHRATFHRRNARLLICDSLGLQDSCVVLHRLAPEDTISVVLCGNWHLQSPASLAHTFHRGGTTFLGGNHEGNSPSERRNFSPSHAGRVDILHAHGGGEAAHRVPSEPLQIHCGAL